MFVLDYLGFLKATKGFPKQVKVFLGVMQWLFRSFKNYFLSSLNYLKYIGGLLKDYNLGYLKVST